MPEAVDKSKLFTTATKNDFFLAIRTLPEILPGYSDRFQQPVN